MTRIPEPSSSPASLPPKACQRLGKSPAVVNKQCEQLGPRAAAGSVSSLGSGGQDGGQRGRGWLGSPEKAPIPS